MAASSAPFLRALPPWERLPVLKSLLPLLAHGGMAPCVCKIDCLKTGDADVFQSLGLPCVTGLSGDICPDHFLVSNLSELWGGRTAWGGH